MDRFLAFSHSVKEAAYSALGWLGSVMLLLLTLFALLEIVRRYIFSVVFEWGQDAIIVGMVSAVAFFFCVTQVRRSHLVINAVMQFMQARGYYKSVGILKIVVSVCIVLFCGFIGITGWSTLSYAWDRNLTTYSLLIPQWPFYLILMFGFLSMAFIALLQTVEDIISYVRGEHFSTDIELTTDI
jgi:TRAP-type C4-dicarboxylate transport system permease small subunit